MKRIFVLHHENALLNAYEDMLRAFGYEVFATANHYEFLLYAGEIASDMLIFDTEDKIDTNFVKIMKNQKKIKDTPLLIIAKQKSHIEPLPEITYLLFKPFEIAELINILPKDTQKETNLPTDNFFYVENTQKAQDLPDILS